MTSETAIARYLQTQPSDLVAAALRFATTAPPITDEQIRGIERAIGDELRPTSGKAA